MSTKVKKQITNMLVFSSLAVAGLFVMFWDQKNVKKDQNQKELDQFVFSVEKKHDQRQEKERKEIIQEISELRLTSPKNKSELVLQRSTNKRWNFTKPFPARANNKAVDDLLDEVLKAKMVRSVLTVKEKDQKAGEKYGLNDKSHKIIFVHDKKRFEASVGSKDPYSGDYFIRVGGSNKIATVSNPFFYSLDKKMFDLRLKKLFTQQTKSIQTLSLSRKKDQLIFSRRYRIDVLKKKVFDGWDILHPIRGNASRKKLDGLLSNLQHNLKAKKYVSENQTDAAKFGLDQPDVRIDLELGSKKVKRSLAITRFQKKTYAMVVGTGPIALVESNLLQELTKELIEYREKTLVRFKLSLTHGAMIHQKEGAFFQLVRSKVDGGTKDIWSLIEEGKTKKVEEEKAVGFYRALNKVEAKSFVAETTNAENLKRYELDKPQMTFLVQGNSSRKILAALYVGKQVGPIYYATNHKKKKIFIIPVSEVNKIPKAPWQFLKGGKPPQKKESQKEKKVNSLDKKIQQATTKPVLKVLKEKSATTQAVRKP